MLRSFFYAPRAKYWARIRKRPLNNTLNSGGGFVGIHAAADCEYDFPWYGNWLVPILNPIRNSRKQNLRL